MFIYTYIYIYIYMCMPSNRLSRLLHHHVHPFTITSHFLLLTNSQSHPSDVGSLEPFQKIQPCQITSMPNHKHRHSNHATSQAIVKYRDGLRISSVPSCAAEMIFARALCTCARPRAPHVCATVNALCLVPRSILRPCMISHKSLFLHSLTSKFSEC